MNALKPNIGNLFIWIGNRPGAEKITTGGILPGIHHTVIFKGDKRVVDIHKAIDASKNNEKSYEQILEMRFFTFLRFLIAFRDANLQLMQEFWFSKRINLGKLTRHNLIMMQFAPDESEKRFFVRNRPAKKLTFPKEINTEHIKDLFFHVDKIPQIKENSFWVYSNKNDFLKREGMIFRPDNTLSVRSFYFVSNKSFNKYNARLHTAVLNILGPLNFTNKEAVIAILGGVGKAGIMIN